MRVQIKDLDKRLIGRPPVTEVPVIEPPVVRRLSGSVVMLKAKAKADRPRVVKPEPVAKKKRKRQANGQHDEHVRRYKKLSYMREYMHRRNHPERYGVG
jgi:hypothetical protein